MAVALKVKDVERLSRRGRKITYEPTFSGNYGAPTTGADVLSFLTATNPDGLPGAYPGEVPSEIQIVNPVAGFGFSGEIGTSLSTSSLRVFDGPGVATYTANDIKGATAITAVMATADQAAAPVNAALLSAEATFTAMAGTVTLAGQPDVPRNVVCTVHNDSGGGLNLFVGNMDVVVTGKDLFGRTATETIRLTTIDANKAVANTKFRMFAGTQVFSSITSATITNSPADADGGLKFSLGVGCKLGIPGGLENAAEADVLAVNVKDVFYDKTGKVDTTAMSLNVGTIADGDDVFIEYRKGAEFPLGQAYPASLTGNDDHMRIAAIFRF